MARKIRTWILVADGSRAKIYEASGTDPELREIVHEEAAALQTHEIVSDRSGRHADHTGRGRHAVGAASDPQRHREHEFARRICAFLDAAAEESAYDRLILTAAPATLGDIRDMLHKKSRALVHAEIDKDFVSVPPHELSKRLADIAGV